MKRQTPDTPKTARATAINVPQSYEASPTPSRSCQRSRRAGRRAGSRDAVLAARAAGHDVTWIVEVQPGAADDVVLARAFGEDRVLITFEKDFGELVFRHGRSGSPGVILLRPRLRSPEIVTAFIVTVLSQPIDWRGYFTVAREGALRVVPLP